MLGAGRRDSFALLYCCLSAEEEEAPSFVVTVPEEEEDFFLLLGWAPSVTLVPLLNFTSFAGLVLALTFDEPPEVVVAVVLAALVDACEATWDGPTLWVWPPPAAAADPPRLDGFTLVPLSLLDAPPPFPPSAAAAAESFPLSAVQSSRASM